MTGRRRTAGQMARVHSVRALEAHCNVDSVCRLIHKMTRVAF